MAAIAGRPPAPLPSAAADASSRRSFNFISRSSSSSPRILRSRPSKHPIPSKPSKHPFPSKPSNHPIPFKTPELSKNPIPSKTPELSKNPIPSKPSKHPIPSKTPELSKNLIPSKPLKTSKNPTTSKPLKTSKNPTTSKPQEPSKNPIPFKPPKPKPVTRCNMEIKSPNISPTSDSSLKTPKPPDLLPRWNFSSKVHYDWKGNLRLQTRPRLPTMKQNISNNLSSPALPMPSQKLHISKPTKDHRIPIPADMPPVEVCASPEIARATLLAPTTASFNAGHLIDGDEDGRSCRPRGLLTVGGPVTEVPEGAEGLPPLMKASMLWFSSPSGNRSSGINNSSHSRFRTVLFRDDDSVKPPWDEERSCPSPVSETPESGSNGSNTSPFTLILKRAAAGHWGFLSPSSVMCQKGDDMIDKEAKLKGKELIMETAKNNHNAEQEKKRLDPEFHKEMLQTEKEVKTLQDEAVREEKRHEKEEVEMKKQLKKQQEEAETDQSCQETEEAELRKQLKKQQEEAEREYLRSEKEAELEKQAALQKQATIMECFPKSTPGKVASPNEELAYNKAIHNSDEQNQEKLLDGWEEASPDDTFCQFNVQTAPTCSHMLTRKLLQFDNSPRPAYYGTWRKESTVVRPRYYLKKNPNLDCDVDSDKEREEEEPGESLSNCDKDDEEEQLDKECHSKSDNEDESEDGFFVPDGYVSENEEVQSGGDELLDDMEEDAKSSQSCKPYILSDELRALMRQQKCLNNLTEQALRKSQTLVILNLMHDKSELVIAEGLTGKPKLEQACLQALCMRTCPGATSVIDVPTVDNTSKEEKEVSRSQKKTTTNGDSPAAISESDMLKFIRSIRACSQEIRLEGQEVS